MPRFAQAIKNFYQYIKRGGVTEVKVCTPLSFDGKPLLGKVALVIGGSSGIGKSIARGLKEMGAEVVVTGTNDMHLNEVVEEIKGIETIKWDISETDIAGEMIKKCKNIYGRLDVLVNSAGIYDGSDIDKVTTDIYDRIMNVNLKGVYFATQEFIRQCDASSENRKKIINILSIGSYVPYTNVYSVSKWGELGFTKGLAKELLDKNIIVNAIAPGPTATNINGIKPEDNLYNAGRRHVNYYMIPEDMSNVVKFLACDFSNGIVGQTIIVDGGETLL